VTHTVTFSSDTYCNAWNSNSLYFLGISSALACYQTQLRVSAWVLRQNQCSQHTASNKHFSSKRAQPFYVLLFEIRSQNFWLSNDNKNINYLARWLKIKTLISLGTTTIFVCYNSVKDSGQETSNLWHHKQERNQGFAKGRA